MKVFKFGGASVKNAEGVRNVGTILLSQPSEAGSIIIVVSAMGKTTNALEKVMTSAWQKDEFLNTYLAEVKNYHYQIMEELFTPQQKQVYEKIGKLFLELENYLSNINQDLSFDLHYDQVVSFGELFASVILHGYLQQIQVSGQWLDCRTIIQTNKTWREAKVDWAFTKKCVQEKVKPLLSQGHVITQGFLGGTDNGFTTTLGREGSDYSAAIFAHCLPAESVTIWKDVAGLLNADPKLFPDTVLYDEISYQETVEMAYYGASVIHPKTIKPLATSRIPLFVKSFLDPGAQGTIIHDCQHEKIAPAFIVKQNQCLISFQEKDFAFINESNLSTIFAALSDYRFKINLMQNSAISFSVCSDNDEARLQQVIITLKDQFTIHYNTGLSLFTIRNYNETSIHQLTQNRTILLEQRSRATYQFVSKT